MSILRVAVCPAESAAPIVTTGMLVTSMRMLMTIASVRLFHACMNLESGESQFISLLLVSRARFELTPRPCLRAGKTKAGRPEPLRKGTP